MPAVLRPLLGPWLALVLALPAAAQGLAPMVGPYKHAPLGLDAASQRLAGLPAGGGVLFWAFATGECGSETWGEGIDPVRFGRANAAAFMAAGKDYIVATGGEAGIFTCGSDAGMQRFLARYDSPRLRGLDFDIEGRQTPEQIDALAARAAYLQRQRPKLRLSFTLATHASADGSRRSLNALGEQVLGALQRHGVDRAVLNLMVMNYGPADARWCVLRENTAPPACDMGRSALQAVRNVHEKYQLPYSRIAVTAMPGENDVAGNLFTPEDASLLARGARELGLAGVHWWSLDRDQPCAAASPRVSPLCHGLPSVPAGRFAELLAPG